MLTESKCFLCRCKIFVWKKVFRVYVSNIVSTFYFTDKEWVTMHCHVSWVTQFYYTTYKIICRNPCLFNIGCPMKWLYISFFFASLWYTSYEALLDGSRITVTLGVELWRCYSVGFSNDRKVIMWKVITGVAFPFVHRRIIGSSRLKLFSLGMCV